MSSCKKRLFSLEFLNAPASAASDGLNRNMFVRKEWKESKKLVEGGGGGGFALAALFQPSNSMSSKEIGGEGEKKRVYILKEDKVLAKCYVLQTQK